MACNSLHIRASPVHIKVLPLCTILRGITDISVHKEVGCHEKNLKHYLLLEIEI